MHSCFVEEPLHAGAFSLSAEESAHVARVLRMRPGEPVRLLDGERLWEGRIETLADKAVTVRAARELPSPEPRARVTLYQGVPKADKLELIVQKATELGVWAVQPVAMERSVGKDKSGDGKRERLRRIALEAAKQAGRAHVPEVFPARTLPELEASLREQELLLLAWEEARDVRLPDALAQATERHGRPPERIGVIIGPEGGISASEAAWLTALGAIPVTLGPRILRTETAGLCCVSVLLALLGDL